jgi:hypothetical protein
VELNCIDLGANYLELDCRVLGGELCGTGMNYFGAGKFCGTGL